MTCLIKWNFEFLPKKAYFCSTCLNFYGFAIKNTNLSYLFQFWVEFFILCPDSILQNIQNIQNCFWILPKKAYFCFPCNSAFDSILKIFLRVSLFPPPATRDSWHLLLVPEGAGSVQVSEVRGAQWSMGDHSSLEQTDTQGSLTLGKWQNTIVQPEKGTKSYELWFGLHEGLCHGSVLFHQWLSDLA